MTLWPDMPMHLLQPEALPLVLLAAVPIGLAWRAKRRGRGISRMALAAQCIALAAVGLAVADPRIADDSAQAPWLVLRDVSGSMRTQTGRSFEPPDDIRLRERRFAVALLPQAPNPAPDARDATHIAPALDLATAQARELAGVVILTDGQFTDAWQAAARRLSETGLETLIVPLDTPPADARITHITAQRRASGETDLAVSLAANATVTRTLDIYPGFAAIGQPLKTQTLGLDSHLPTSARFLLPAPSDEPDASAARPATRWPAYLAVLRPADDVPENDQASAVLNPPGRRIATLVSPANATPDPGALAAASRQAGPVPQLPPSVRLEQLADLQAVVLVTAGGGDLDTSTQQALGDYVRAGGTLVMLGTGPRATPADRQAPLNQIAALVPNPFQRSPLDLVVVLDASGSMAQTAATDAGRRAKFDLASSATLALRRHLTDRDRLRVIAFAETADTLYDSGQQAPDFGALAQALRAVRPAGPTHVDVALAQAAATAPDAGRLGLVLVLSDLDTRPVDAPALAGAFETNRWQLAVVQTGSTAPANMTPLERLAGLTDGQVMFQADLTDLAEVFGALVRQGRGLDARPGPFDIQAPGPWARIADLPDPAMLVLTAPTEGTTVLATADDEPLLGVRRVGLGTSWTLPLELTGLADSSDTAGLAETIAEILRRTPEGNPAWDLTATLQGAELALSLRADPQLTTANGRKLVAEVLALHANEDPRLVAVPQTALGHYRLTVPLHANAASVRVRDADTGELLARTTGSRMYPAEFERLGAAHDTLSELAAETGGKVVRLDEVSGWMRQRLRRGQRPLWPWLLAAGLAIMLGQWVATRIRHTS